MPMPLPRVWTRNTILHGGPEHPQLPYDPPARLQESFSCRLVLWHPLHPQFLFFRWRLFHLCLLHSVRFRTHSPLLGTFPLLHFFQPPGPVAHYVLFVTFVATLNPGRPSSPAWLLEILRLQS